MQAGFHSSPMMERGAAGPRSCRPPGTTCLASRHGARAAPHGLRGMGSPPARARLASVLASLARAAKRVAGTAIAAAPKPSSQRVWHTWFKRTDATVLPAY